MSTPFAIAQSRVLLAEEVSVTMGKENRRESKRVFSLPGMPWILHP